MTATRPFLQGPEAPPPPSPLGPEARERLREENQALVEQIQNRALREAAGRGEDGRAMGVVRDAKGLIVVTGRDGRTVTIDPNVVTDEDAVQEIVRTALEPPRFPEPARPGPSEAVQIVGIVMTMVLLLSLGVPLVRAYLRRQSAPAPAGPSPELAGRLTRIEQAIEAVAIEVERIAESERYSARLLTERLPGPAVAPGPAGAPAAHATADVPR